MTDSQRMQIGLWGYGQHAKKNIIPAILASDVCDLAGICTMSDDNEFEIKEKFNVSVWRNPETMLSDPCLHAIYLATPIGLHYVHGKQVLAANRHLLCEKSLTNNGSDSLDLIDCAEKKGLVIFEAFMYLYHPQFQLVREIVCRDDFGAITDIISNFCIPTLDNPGFRSSKVLGGGAFWDIGCYTVSVALELLKVFPKIEYCETVFHGKEEVDVSGRALIKYSPKTAAYLNWSYNHSYKNDLVVLGENKSIYVDRVFSKSRGMASTVTIMDKTGTKTDMNIPAADSFVKMFEVFARAINAAQLKKQLCDQARRQSEFMSSLHQLSLHANGSD